MIRQLALTVGLGLGLGLIIGDVPPIHIKAPYIKRELIRLQFDIRVGARISDFKNKQYVKMGFVPQMQ